MNRTFIAFIFCSLSTLNASEPDLNSPTYHYQNNVEWVHTRIQAAILKKALIKGQLRKEVLCVQDLRALANTKREIKHFKREEKRLASLQID
jgi:hypothetical protein